MRLSDWGNHADQEGQDINLLADELLTLILEWEAQDHAEAVQGIRRGLQAFEQGQCRPFHAFDAEQRAKPDLPSVKRDTT